MEKRKLLLVAVSVGVFLVIVLSAAILIFTPSGGGAVIARPLPPGGTASGIAANPRPPASADAADMVRNTGDLQGLKIPPPAVTGSDSSGVSGAPVSASAVQENSFYINDGNPLPPADRPEGGSAQVVINVPQPSAPGVPAPGPRPPSRMAVSPAVPVGQEAGTGGAAGNSASTADTSSGGSVAAASGGPASSAAVKPAASGTAASNAASGTGAKPAASSAAPASNPVSGTAAKPAASASGGTASNAGAKSGGAAPIATSGTKPAAPARTAANSASSRPKARPQQDYWIQTGAFSALVRAENAKEILASKGLLSIIDDREMNGQTWYRVRVGPYTSENEANYWLALVQAIDGFDGSQVRSSQR